MYHIAQKLKNKIVQMKTTTQLNCFREWQTAKNKLNIFLVKIIKMNRIVKMEATEAFKVRWGVGGDYPNMVEGEGVMNLSKYG